MNSFSAETLVLLADGTTKPINKVLPGDQVLATDPSNQTTTPREVTAQHINQDTDFTDLTLQSHGARFLLHTTQSHPFWDTAEQKWTEASRLTIGHSLATTSAGQMVVSEVRDLTGHETMYNLTVADIHTYNVIVGNAPILVHNCPSDGPEPSGASSNYPWGSWNAQTVLPSGRTVGQVGRDIWGNGLPSAERLAGMTGEELRGIASLEDAQVLNEMYKTAQAAIPSNDTAKIRVILTQQIIDAWGVHDG